MKMWNNRNNLFLIALIVSCFVTESLGKSNTHRKLAHGTNSHFNADKGLIVAQTSLNTFELIMKGVEILTTSNIVASISSIIGPLGSVLGIVGGIMKILKKEPNIEHLFAEQTALITESFNAMSDQLNRLSEQMQESENRIIATAQYQGVFEKIAKIDTSLEMIPLMLKSYPRNRSRLLENIDDKLRNYGNLDSDLTNLVFVQSPATSQQSSLIDSIASLCTPEFQFCKIASSTNQVIFEFYKHIMVYISKVKVFQTLSYQIRQFLTGDNHSEDIEFVNNKVKRNMQKIMTSLRMTLTKYNDSKHLKSYLQMIKSPSEGYNYEKLQRVMYNAILREENLSSSNTCQETCPYYNRSSINHNACKGILYNCDYSGFYATYQVYSTTPDRYYSAYYKYGEWFGQNVDHLSTRWDSWISTYTYWFVTCDACLCTCDATADSKSHRYFYTGLIEVQTAGHVITGVRFAKKEKAIFIQIQTGKLLPLGMIALETIAWQALPALGNTYTSVDMNHRQLALPDLTLPKKFALTGVQFSKFGNNDISISIKGKSFNYLSGVLNAATVSKSYTSVASSTYAENTIPLVEIGVPTYDVYSNIKISMGKGNEKKYAGQSFLPYFDSQNIELTIPAPLSGLELIYYNTPEYGGFIRPRISSINYLDYLLTTSNNTSTEEYDGDVETINFNTGDWRGDSQIDHSSAKDLTFMMPCILISSMVLFFC